MIFDDFCLFWLDSEQVSLYLFICGFIFPLNYAFENFESVRLVLILIFPMSIFVLSHWEHLVNVGTPFCE